MAHAKKVKYTQLSRGVRVTKETAIYYAVYKDEFGRWKRKPGYLDKEATVKYARKLEKEAAQRREGIITPEDDAQQTAINEHLEAYEKHLGQQKRRVTPKHTKLTLQRIRSVIQGIGAKRLSDITEDAVMEYLTNRARSKEERRSPTGEAKSFEAAAKAFGVSFSTIHGWSKRGAPIRARQPIDLAAVSRWRDETFREEISAKSIAHYVTALRMFTGWLLRKRKVAVDPLADIVRPNAETDRRLVRRSLTIDEQRSLLAVARNGGDKLEIDGETRAVVYAVALGTGFRREEIATLTPRSFDLDGKTVTIEARSAKNRKRDTLPITAELAAMLAAYFRKHHIKATVCPWQHLSEICTAKMIRHDLEAAGIETVDENGERVDFHALRTSYISNLARAGVPLVVAQKLARHSDPKLTANVYTSLGIIDMAGAVEKLPDINTPPATADASTKKA